MSTELRRLPATDAGVVLRHGEREFGDQYGARDVWVYTDGSRNYMHYDAAGEKGWLVALAISDDGLNWSKRGTVLELGIEDEPDSASASYGTTFYDGHSWHMFYLGTPNVTPDELKVPSFPYLTLAAQAEHPGGPWQKKPGSALIDTETGSYHSDTASPGAVVCRRQPGAGGLDTEYAMFLSVSTTNEEGEILRSLSVARADRLDGPWRIDDEPLLPMTEQIENSSLYFEEAAGLWFLFTNHIGQAEDITPIPPQQSTEYTDAIWVYWAPDLGSFNSTDRAVVLDSSNCLWSPRVIGLPSVLRVGNRLAVYYDGAVVDGIGHGGRDIGVAWLDLPLTPPL